MKGLELFLDGEGNMVKKTIESELYRPGFCVV